MRLENLIGPRLLAVGEPTHGEPAFPRLRNEIFARLAGRGFRSIAIESDRVAGLAVDDFVRHRAGPAPDGFSHRLGELPANRALVAWMRDWNRGRSENDQLAFHGFDAPLEMMSAAGPGRHLRHVRDYLGASVPDLDRLLGPDERWSDPAAQLDAARSAGRSPEAAALRALADDLLTQLYAQAPRLVAATSRATWHSARVHAQAAIGLLRYHAVAAEAAPQAERASRMLAVRDALMAENLLDIRTQEQDRGPTLVFAHNRHLQAHPSRWHLAGMDLEWPSAGSIVATLLGDDYRFVPGSLGASSEMRLPAPAAETYEALLSDGVVGLGLDACLVAPPAAGVVREDVRPEHGYFPLDAETVAGTDVILHVSVGDDPAAALAERILALPGVGITRVSPDSGMPDYTWGDRFFFAGEDRKHPFATIVGHDYTGFDEKSRVDRPGFLRLNIELGRDEFKRVFGYGPESFSQHEPGIDFAAQDVLLPHPAYAVQGWACVVNPGNTTRSEVDRLLEYARARSATRHT